MLKLFRTPAGKIAELWGRLRKRERRRKPIRQETPERLDHQYYECENRVHLKYGKEFITNFRPRFYKAWGKNAAPRNFMVGITRGESGAVRVSLCIPEAAEKSRGKRVFSGENVIFSAKVAFEKGAVVIEEFQGALEVSDEINALEKSVRMPAANFLCAAIEDAAKRTGYAEVRIMRPENTHDYNRPLVYDYALSKTPVGRKFLKKIPGRGKQGRNRLTPGEKGGSAEHIKHFQWYDKVLAPEEQKEYDGLMDTICAKIRKRINKRVDGVVLDRGYEQLEDYFRKKLRA